VLQQDTETCYGRWAETPTERALGLTISTRIESGILYTSSTESSTDGVDCHGAISNEVDYIGRMCEERYGIDQHRGCFKTKKKDTTIPAKFRFFCYNWERFICSIRLMQAGREESRRHLPGREQAGWRTLAWMDGIKLITVSGCLLEPQKLLCTSTILEEKDPELGPTGWGRRTYRAGGLAEENSP
jgi:hypothetical protein